jgi:aarF domain-containing kinase
MGKGNIDYSHLFNELRTVFSLELDYLREAEILNRYQELSKNKDEWLIPRVFSEISTERVLAMSYEPGITISDAVREQKLTKESRQFYGHSFLELYATEFCSWGLVQTDPNLGNFLLIPENRQIVLLDFGATKEYTVDFRIKYAQLIFAALHQDRLGILRLAEELQLLNPQEPASAKNAFIDLMQNSMKPFKAPTYDFSEASYAESMKAASRHLMNELKYSPPPHPIIFLHRKLSGLFQILRRLEVETPLQPFLDQFQELADSKK